MGNLIPELPILGEPLLPEFANTLYVGESVRLDVLDRVDWIRAWLGTAPCVAGLAVPRRISGAELDRLRVLRDAVRSLLTRTSGDDCRAEIAVINDAARRSGGRRLLGISAAGELVVETSRIPSGLDQLVALIASRFIEVVDAGELDLIEVCGRPACTLFYFRDHHRRRYCNARCANADRQARYNRRRDAVGPHR